MELSGKGMIARFDEITQETQLLRNHLLNVAILASSFGKKIKMDKLLYLAGILHDLGKYHRNFQQKIKRALEAAKLGKTDGELINLHFDHGVFGAKYIYDKNRNSKNPKERLTAEILALVCCYHHGGLPDSVKFKGNERQLYECENKANTCCEEDEAWVSLLKRMDDVQTSDMDHVVDRFFKENNKVDIDKLFSHACEEIGVMMECLKEVTQDQGVALGMVIKCIYSMLVDADRYDCVLFEQRLLPKDVLDNMPQNWEKYLDELEKYIAGLQNDAGEGTDEELVELRTQINGECLLAAKRSLGVYNLTVPTGGGKTFSSIAYALCHGIAQQKERIIYVIPYTTIIEQNAEVVRKALKCKDGLLEHHSNVVVDNEDGKYRLLTERWDRPIVFTTMVQFLNTLFSGGTQNIRRMHQLLNATIIFDEVQTVPVKCTYLFFAAINFLCKMGNSTAIMCSATQPNFSDGEKRITEYGKPKEIISGVKEKYKSLERVKIIDARKEAGSTIESLARFTWEKKQGRCSVLVVVNKVKSATALYDAVKEYVNDDTVLYFFSSNMCPSHRMAKLSEMRKALKGKKDIICISTQVLEAGVDISFETGIRCMAGLDSIAQTAGRINRDREEGMGYCYLVAPDEGSFGKLFEINKGRTYTAIVLDRFSKNPGHYDGSLLSPMAIDEYFKLYFADADNKKTTQIGRASCRERV